MSAKRLFRDRYKSIPVTTFIGQKMKLINRSVSVIFTYLIE